MKYCKWCGLGFEYIRTTKVCCSKKCKVAEYYEENKEKIAEYKKEYDKEYNKENAEKLAEYRKEYNKEYRKVNKDKQKEYNKEYKKAHPEKCREYKRKRRAMKLAVNENYTALDEQYTKELFQNKCFNCGSTKYLCIDHIFPLSMGNPLTKHNACVLCKSCNSHKSDKLSENFYTLEKLIELFILTA